jgi:4-hydroxy-tetrahydrodipicolinate reductase
MAEPIRVGVLGAGGRMGSTVCRAVIDAPDCELVGAVDPHHVGIDLAQLGIAGSGLQLSGRVDALLDAGVQVVVDFTVLDAARSNLEWCAANDVHAVVGTTGFSEADLAHYRALFSTSAANAAIVPNFAVGAVLMMRFAEAAAPYFDTAEIIELHHDEKADAPSGTAMSTAARIADASDVWAPDPTTNEILSGARGAVGPGGIRIHSVRMRGMIAHQEVILGASGQTLTLRHDSYDRTSFMPGVLLAIRSIAAQSGLTVGLDAFM